MNRKRINFVLTLLIYLTFLTSCNRIPNKVSKNIEKSGKNQAELLKVIDHFKNDKEKLAATYFLIGNMESRISLVGNFTNYYSIYSYIDSLYKSGINKKDLDSAVKKRFEILEQKYGSIQNTKYEYLSDLQNIKSEDLIENIDLAFKIWKTKPWCKNIDFNTFCNFILPYRHSNEPICNFRRFFINEFSWLEDSLKNPSDIKEVCLRVNNFLYKKFKFVDVISQIPLPSAIDMYKFGAGDCERRYFLFISAMRSLGIPVAVDFSFQWNHWPGQHSWVTLITNDKNIPFNAGEYYKEFPNNSTIPIGGQTASTVFRKYFETQNIFEMSDEYSEFDIPENFRELNIKNVSHEYNYPQLSLKLKELNIKNDSTVFLGCFGYGEDIIAIDFKLKDKESFNKIGRCGIYVPFNFKNNKKIFLSQPFILSCEGDGNWYRFCNPIMKYMDTIILTRKFAVQDSMKVFSKAMIGDCFQVSNDSHFSRFETIYTINFAPTYFVDITPNYANKFRYIRYISQDTNKINVAEIEFYNGNKKLTGKVIESSNSTLGKNVFDGDIRTNYISASKSWVGLDLGQPQNITNIRFLPRNNFNIIEPGDVYELLYFDYGWKSLGIKKANSSKLIYTAPRNALFLLKNLTKGKEERIFKYENNEQIFW